MFPEDFGLLRERLTRLETRQVTVAPDQREAAVAIVLAAAGGGGIDLLLIKRAEHPDDPWSGQIALPGGRRDGGDVDLYATAVRETREETGVLLAPSNLLGVLDDLSPVSRHLPQLVVRPFVFCLPARPPVTLSEEVALHLWVPCDALWDGLTEESLTIRGQEWRVAGYRIGAHFVWGMTERILTPLLRILRQA